jgi:predicted DNA-binding transcriptional regulator AlpA
VEKPDLLTLVEAAELCRTPEASLRWRRHCGLPPRSFKLGRRVMYKRSDLEDWVAQAYMSGTGATHTRESRKDGR